MSTPALDYLYSLGVPRHVGLAPRPIQFFLLEDPVDIFDVLPLARASLCPLALLLVGHAVGSFHAETLRDDLSFGADGRLAGEQDEVELLPARREGRKEVSNDDERCQRDN